MKTTIIQLEAYDDITSARDKIAWCRSGRILLVLPEDFNVLERRIDLSLLKRYSQELGVQIGIISSDPVVQANARETGIPLFLSAAVAQKIPWRRTRFRHKTFNRPGSAGKLAELQASAAYTPVRILTNRIARWAVFTAAILAVATLVVFFLPSATISLPDIRNDQTVDLSVWASPEITTLQPSGGLPASVISLVAEGQGQVPASGRVMVQTTAAIGSVKFTNLTASAVKVPAGTIVQASGPVNERFEVLQETIVPAGIGQASFTQVQAVNNGVQGNIGAGEINAVEGSLGLQLTVINLGPTQGGENHQVSSPSPEDYQTLHEQIIQSLTKNAETEFQQKLAKGEQLIPSSIVLKTILEEKVDPALNTPSDSLGITLKVEFSAWTIQLNDLEAVEKFALDAGLPGGTAALGGAIQSIDLSEPQIDQTAARWKVRANRPIRKIWNRDSMIALAAGKDPATAINLLSGQVGPGAVIQIKNQPAWWPLLPFLTFRIAMENQ